MITSDTRDKIIDYFWEELESWDYDSWTSSSSGDKEDIVKGVILELEIPSELEEEVYNIFWEWVEGIDETYFN